jgi:hypothetical protein
MSNSICVHICESSCCSSSPLKNHFPSHSNPSHKDFALNLNLVLPLSFLHLDLNSMQEPNKKYLFDHGFWGFRFPFLSDIRINHLLSPFSKILPFVLFLKNIFSFLNFLRLESLFYKTWNVDLRTLTIFFPLYFLISYPCKLNVFLDMIKLLSWLEKSLI